MFDVLAYFAPAASYYLYQAVDAEGNVYPIPFARSVEAAIEDGVDVLNVSAGRERPACRGRGCAFCHAARRAVRAGITVVAGAGNGTPDADATVHCPAFADPVIAVGGYVAECTFRFPMEGLEPSSEDLFDAYDSDLYGPNACWARLRDDHDYRPTAVDVPLCTARGCAPDESCAEHLAYRPWEHNPTPAGEKPDVLAPVQYAENTPSGAPCVHGGSSYGAPIVAGSIASIEGTLLDHQRSASPPRYRDAAVDGSVALDPDTAGRFDYVRTLDELL